MLGAGHLPQDCRRPESPVCPHVCCLFQDFSAGVQLSLFHHDCSGLLWCRLGAAQPQCLNLYSGRRPLRGGMCVGECRPCIHWLALAWLLGTGVPTGVLTQLWCQSWLGISKPYSVCRGLALLSLGH